MGLDDRRPLGSAVPAILSVNAPRQPNPGGTLPNGTSATVGHGCTNCYSIPVGTGQNWDPGSSGIGPSGPSSAATFDWLAFNTAGNSGTNGLRNQFDPYHIAWYDANQQRNGGHITVDQRLTSNISFYGSAFYSNRRATFLNPGNLSPAGPNILANVGVPTFNPYYPTNAPNNLRANYNLAWESPPITNAYELAQRYQLGLNIALPFEWSGRLWFAETKDFELQSQHRHREQSRCIRGPGLDARHHRRSGNDACDRDLDQAREHPLPELVLRPDGLHVQLQYHPQVHRGRENL